MLLAVSFLDPVLLFVCNCRREYNRRVREIVEASWVEDDAAPAGPS